MSRRYLLAAGLVAVIAIGLISLRPLGERGPPVAQEISEEKGAVSRKALSSVAIEVEPTAAGSVPGTEDCPRKMTLDEVREYGDRLDKHFTDVAYQLSESSDAEKLLAASLLLQLEPDGASLELLDRAFRLAPSSPLVAWNMLRTCRDHEAVNCDLAHVEANALRVDGDNGAVWMEVAVLRLAENRPDLAAAAVQEAIAAPRFDTYYIDHALLVERALAAGGDSTYVGRMTSGLAHSAMVNPSFYGITEHCQIVDAADAVWIELCHQLGEKMFADSKVLLDQSVGISLIKVAVGHTQDAEKIEASIRRETEFRQRYQEQIMPLGTQILLANDEAVLRQFVDNFVTFGEFEANARLAEEVARLRESDAYDQCNFVNPLAGQ